ncbi:MAG: hypothetical protein KDC48_01325 [Planctomycetes bacterium]|nr:hypothetical protein [Planctomycetota bacterium]
MLRALAVLLLAPFASAQQPFPGLLARFAGHDVDADGTAEIRRLETIGGAGEATAPRVIVFVEQRLLTPRAGVDEAAIVALRERLQRFAADLAAGGRRCELVGAEVYSGPRHQDGRIVLALRRVLQAARAAGPLQGAILVGHFPDALLLRTCNWRRGDDVELVGRDGEKRAFHGYLRAVPENVAWKCDLVLADLDGDWEGRYFEAATELPRIQVAFDGPVPEGGGPFLAADVRTSRFVDAFHLADGRVHVDVEAGASTVDDATRDEECTDADRRAANPLALPEIAVSRIDARGVAWSPRPRFVGGEGAPQRVALADGEKAPGWDAVWQPDPALELQLLMQYFDRNHAFRTQPPDAAADKPASVAWGLGSGMRSTRGAKAVWRDFDEPGYDVKEHVDLLALLAWWQRPALLRTLRAHSDPFTAVFAKTDGKALDAAVGSPWNFAARGAAMVPSLAAEARGGRADFFFYRSLWANQLPSPQPYVMVHTGCEAISPHGATSLRYDDPGYGVRQHAEAILFYTPCVAMIGRAKVFYDEPRGFCEALAAGGTVGDAWRRYFELEAASSWGQAGGDIGRKRSYFWSLLGDFTLRLP